jgi:3-hydroxybutyrate dehydrogenase
MAEPMEIANMISFAERTFGSVDVLVNNAGIQHVSPIEDFPVEKWDAVLAINLSSAFHAIRAVTPGMKQRGWGRILTTASAHSQVASPFKSAYVAAKHGIVGLTKTVALELARSKITCNCISPGYVWTPLVEKQIPNTMKARNMDRNQVINDVLLAAQPTKEFHHGRAGGFARAVPVWRRRRADHWRQPLYRRRLDGRVGRAEMHTGSQNAR